MMLRRITSTVLALGAAIAVAQGPAPAVAQSPIVTVSGGSNTGPNISRDFFLTDVDAVGMLSPRVVCSAQATRLLWSTDGSVLLVHRVDAPSLEDRMMDMFKGRPVIAPPAMVAPRQELVFYSAKGQKVKAVVPLGDPQNQIASMQWLPGSQQVAVEYMRVVDQGPNTAPKIVYAVVLVASDGRISPIAEVDQDSRLEMVVSPTRPFMAVLDSAERPSLQSSNQTTRLRIIGSDGRAIVDTPIKADGFSEPMWGSDGGFYLIFRRIVGEGKARKVMATFGKVDLSSGRIDTVSAAPKPFAPSSPKLQYAAQPMQMPFSKDLPQQRIDVVALVPTGKIDAENFALVSTDAQVGSLSPTGESVAYITKGVVLLRPVVHIPKDVFLNARNAAKKTELLSKAKQVGLAFLMLASDMDDNMPDAGSNWQDKISPYLKNNDIMNGFVYSFKGGNMTDVEEPANTQLGYIPGPGGKAVVFVDGHAKWIPDPKT